MDDTHNSGTSCASLCPLATAEGTSGAALDRRDFLVRASLLAAAAALAACGGRDSNPTAPANVSLSITVGDYPSLAALGGIALVSAHGSPLAVVRTGNTSFIALSRICPHQGATVEPISNGFACPRHGATFNDLGSWTGGTRTSNLHSYATSYDAGTDVLKIG